MSNKIYRILGKRGRITIPYELRMRNGISQNDVISFEQSEKNTIIVKKEKVCGGLDASCFQEQEAFSVERFLDTLSEEEQRQALIHLSYLWASKQGGSGNVRA